MSVTITLFINPSASLTEIKQVIETRFNVAVSCDETGVLDLTVFNFTPAGDDLRSMYVSTHARRAGFQGTVLSLGSSGRAKEILTAIGEVFGGFLTDEAKNEEITQLNGELEPANGTSFFHRYAIIDKGMSCEDGEGMLKVWEEFDRETKSRG